MPRKKGRRGKPSRNTNVASVCLKSEIENMPRTRTFITDYFRTEKVSDVPNSSVNESIIDLGGDSGKENDEANTMYNSSSSKKHNLPNDTQTSEQTHKHITLLSNKSNLTPYTVRSRSCDAAEFNSNTLSVCVSSRISSAPSSPCKAEDRINNKKSEFFQNTEFKLSPIRQTESLKKRKNKSVRNSRCNESSAAQTNAVQHKMTDFFHIRRSERRPKTILEKEFLAHMEDRLMSDSDDTSTVEICHFVGKGRGVIALRNFSKGEFVIEYAGEIIDVTSAKRRETVYAMDVRTGCYMYYFKHQSKQYCIDATRESGRLGRLVNHSRTRPNMLTKVVVFKNEPRLILVARRDIQKNEELLYDYGDRSKKSLIDHPWLAL